MVTNYELKNVRVFKLYSITNIIILGPIITLFYLAKGLNFTEIMLLNSVAAFAVMLFEVPTGAVADRFSRKWSLAIGALLWAISLLIFIFSSKFYEFAIAEVIFSLGLTFKSGADHALLYDTLKNVGREKEYQKILGDANSYSFYSQAIGSVVAGFIFAININLPLIVSILLMIITIIICFNFDEPVINRTIYEKKSYFMQIGESVKFVLGHKKVLGIFLFSIVFYYFYRVGFFFFQPYMKAVNIPVYLFGVIFFVFNIVAANASKNVELFIKKTKPRSLFVLASLIFVSMILLGITKYWIGVIFILMQQVARGLNQPVQQKYLNKHLPSEKRATILSLKSLTCNLIIGIFGPFAGYLLDNYNVFISLTILGIIMFILILLVNFYIKK